ncbi:MAG: D-glycero-beta-D-manno-heptose 1,7-bisphosphate 7-phosphatase [Lentisphaeria bacterium]|nr:D-glycero-beta-D-manno-heptose 1,7-bisphosphate 7-phosphatase [Lentisphaeria bacterium]
MVNKAFFLDRDGVINEEIGYLHEPEKTEIISGVAAAIKMMHAAGYLVVAITNQAGVAKGYYPEADVYAVHSRIQQLLLTRYGADALIDAWYYCPHHQDFTGECDCRKPKPGMLLRAAADFNIDLSSSFMIGDRMSDINAGVNAGCAAECLVLTGYGVNEEQKAVDAGIQTAADLPAAVKQLLRI